MCSSEAKVTVGVAMSQPPLAKINGRPVLQPNCNLERRNSVKKITLLPPTPTPNNNTTYNSNYSSITSPRITMPTKNPNPNTNISFSSLTPPISPVGTPARLAGVLDRKKSMSFKGMIRSSNDNNVVDQYQNNINNNNGSCCSIEASYSSALISEAPGSFAAVRREQIAQQHAQRKMKIAHYGRSKSARFDRVVPLTVDSSSSLLLDNNLVDIADSVTKSVVAEEKRCSFITPNSDPIYVAYHDQEWGVPVHDDKLMFELLVLSGAQVGSDWTSILKKRQEFREAFSWFEAEIVSTFTDKHMLSISSQYAIEISRVRGVIDNSNRILEIKKEFGSFEKYIWGFVNNKPISTQYKSGQRIPVKTSKSESISKDMVRRGFRFVGPTVVHSFLQAVGLTNDHLTTCHRHSQCNNLGSSGPIKSKPNNS